MIRILLSIALIGAALGAATVGMLGFQGRMMRKPPFELFPGHGSPGEIASAGAEPFFCERRQLAIATRRHRRPQRADSHRQRRSLSRLKIRP